MKKDYTTHIPGLSKEKQPWYFSWKAAYRRCTDPKNNRYQYYGAKRIRFELPFWETGWIYVRDKAYEMSRPNLHRLDESIGYTLTNCCFIENKKHCSITHKGKPETDLAKINMSRSGGTQFCQDHPIAKLTNEQVLEIKNKLSGRNGRALSKEYGVSTSTISAIKHNKIWKKV